MTILCSYCKKVKGEKCPTCEAIGHPLPQNEGWHFCPNEHCSLLHFRTGQGGESHGICGAPCEEAVKAGVKE